MTKKIPVLCIAGPTASGKTALSVSLAKALSGEIICADAMQIYDKLLIGTARPTKEEQGGVAHHLFGFADPRVPFSCVDYIPLACAAISDITARGNLPVFCGGTGLYLDSVMRGTAFLESESKDTSVADDLRKEAGEHGIMGIWERLRDVDPASADAIHPHNEKRVIRALEIYLTTGVTKTEWDARSHDTPSPYAPIYIGLDYRDRSILHDRIGRRVSLMLENGLEEEVRTLYARGYLPEGGTASQAIGYKEFLAYLAGKMTLDEAAEQLRTATRRYAKRQLTWFRRNPDMHWLYPDEYPEEKQKELLFEKAMEIISSHM